MNWDCADCGQNTKPEYYMVHNHLWAKYAGKAFLLCIGCLERRMGRELWSGDFTHFPINNINHANAHNKSDRLINRLERPEP